MRMEVRLSVTNGKANVKQVVLGPETIIGRSQECNLKIASSQVSRRHSRITVSESEVRVSDLGSANGTFLNGRALPPETEVVVAPGNALTIGPLRFVFHFTPPAPPRIAAPPVPESDTKDAIPLSLLGRPASQLGEEETVDSQGQRKPVTDSPLGPAQSPVASTHDLDTDFEEGLPDRTLTGLKNEPVVVTPPEGAADTVLDMNLAEEARRKAARQAAEAAANGAAPGSDENQIPESHTDSGTALLAPAPAEESEVAAEDENAEFPDFKAVDESEPEERPSPRTRKTPEKKPWGLLGGMFGKSKPKRPVSRREEADEDAAGDEETVPLEAESAPAPKVKKKPAPVDEEDTLQIGPPVTFEDAEAPAPSPTAKAAVSAAAEDFDPADFLMALSSEGGDANLDPHTKEPGEKPVLEKPPEKRVAPRLTPEVKSAAKPSPAPQVKSNKSSEKEDGDPSVSDFLKNL